MRILNLLTNYLVRRLYILSQNNQNPCIKSSNRLYFYTRVAILFAFFNRLLKTGYSSISSFLL